MNNREYYSKITALNIETIARELLAGRITDESSGKIFCNCPNHASTGKRSLEIDTHKQVWNCWGCDAGGDVLHLVEFIQSGCVTKGIQGKMPESHIRARDFLAAKAGLPPLSTYGLTPEQISQVENERQFENRVKEAFTATAGYYHQKLMESTEVLQYIRDKWGIGEATIKRLLIGYSPIQKNNVPGIIAFLTNQGFTQREIASTGAFRLDTSEQLEPFFRNRIIFPYWSQGNVVYLIGRQTPWTENLDWEKGKYKKSLTHNEHDHCYVAKFISNSTLYNEDVLLSNPERIIITEGVTDCISLMEAGFPAISPVTVNIKDKDWNRILPRLKGVQQVYICQDNEISEAGFRGACRTSSKLREASIKSYVVSLPLRDKQRNVRKFLQELFNINFAEISDIFGRNGTKSKKNNNKTTKKLLLSGKTDEEKVKIQQLLSDAKIDVNEWFATGGTPQEFEKLLSQAKTTIDFGIERIPVAPKTKKSKRLKLQGTPVDLEKRNSIILSLLEEIITLPALEQDEYLKKIYERCNHQVSKSTLKAQIKEIKKQREKEIKAKALQQLKESRLAAINNGTAQASTSPSSVSPSMSNPNLPSSFPSNNQSLQPLQSNDNSFQSCLSPVSNLSCRAAIENILIEYEFSQNKTLLSSPFIRAGEVAFQWFTDNGAKFYRSKNDGSFMFFNRRIFFLNSYDRDKKDNYYAFMQKETGMVNTSQSGRTFFETFKNLSIQHGRRINELSWNYTNTPSKTIYFNLNNKANEIIKITPLATEIMDNGGNADRIVLAPSDKIKPITYESDTDIFEAEIKFDELITENLTCSEPERLIIKLWTSSFLLIDYLHSKAILRFEGTQGSGKSSASDLISYLVYGKDWKKRPTTASNYTDATHNPVLIIDNIETKDLSQSFSDFLLTASTGIVKEKRKMGTDSEVITERANCLININGIEPLSGPSAPEILTRTFICNFEERYFQKGFIKTETLEEIKKYRNMILSGIIKRTSIVLNAISEGEMKKALILIENTLGKHHKSRCNEFLALMLLNHLVGVDESQYNKRVQDFFRAVCFVNNSTLEIAQDTNYISAALQAYFYAWRNAEDLDNDYNLGGDTGSRRKFLEHYSLRIRDNTIEEVKANELFTTLKKFARDRSLEFPYTNTKQFAYRLNNDLEIIEKSGLKITIEQDRLRFRLYTIQYQNDTTRKKFRKTNFLKKLKNSNDPINIANFLPIKDLRDVEKASIIYE